MFKVGDEIMVKAEGYDNRGRLNLSRKDAIPKPANFDDKKDNKKDDKKPARKTTKKEDK